jgi:hypothetical protein
LKEDTLVVVEVLGVGSLAEEVAGELHHVVGAATFFGGGA